MPFIPFLTRPDYYYVYDMNRNSIYKISQHQYEALCQIKSGSIEDMTVLEDFQKKVVYWSPL